jgi:hypothetical protein
MTRQAKMLALWLGIVLLALKAVGWGRSSSFPGTGCCCPSRLRWSGSSGANDCSAGIVRAVDAVEWEKRRKDRVKAQFDKPRRK